MRSNPRDDKGSAFNWIKCAVSEDYDQISNLCQNHKTNSVRTINYCHVHSSGPARLSQSVTVAAPDVSAQVALASKHCTDGKATLLLALNGQAMARQRPALSCFC